MSRRKAAVGRAQARTYGTLAHAVVRGTPHWGLVCEPQVMIRAKRLFPRAHQGRTGSLVLTDTLDVARDLDMLLHRYPMRMDARTARLLAARTAEHVRRDEAIAAVLGGYCPPPAGKEPARPLREYQRQAVHLVGLVGATILGDDVGLGKTTSAIGVLLDPDKLPAVIVVPAHLPRQWLAELNTVAPWLLGHIVTSTTPYDPAAKRDCAGRTPDVLIVTYSKVVGWGEHLAGWARTVICDEVQELRNGTATHKGQAVAQIRDGAATCLGLSATPVHNYAGDIHDIYDIIAPGALGERDEFVREWGGATVGVKGHTVVADPQALGAYLRAEGLLLRRTRRDVHRELPDPIRITQAVDTDHKVLDAVADDVAEMARLILDDATDPLERGRLGAQIDWRLRMATGVAKAAYVAEFAKLLLESEQKIVMFGWHRDVYDIWLKALRSYGPVMYTGSESAAQKAASVRAFVEGSSRVFICSLRSGAGLDGLQLAASVAVFGELDWSPAVTTQAIGRLARDGQDATVVAYFMLSDDGTDPGMADMQLLKLGQSEPIMNPDVPLLAPVGQVGDRARVLADQVLTRTRGQRELTLDVDHLLNWPSG